MAGLLTCFCLSLIHILKGLAELEYSFHKKKEYANEFPIHSLKLRYLSDVNQYGQHYLYTSQDLSLIHISWDIMNMSG